MGHSEKARLAVKDDCFWMPNAERPTAKAKSMILRWQLDVEH